MEIRLDKRVYNIGETIDSRGKDISEVLENIPTVSIDVDGNLELRGSSNVRILIDGKPSALVNDGIDILADLPAETIDKVEVITSPSARYQAEGSSGIINIVLAKKGLLGLNGIFNFSAKKNNSFSGNSILNYKKGKLIRGLSRGDGEEGEDITENLKTIRDIPLNVSHPDFPEEIDIRGEVFIETNDFKKIEKDFANP